MTLRPKSYRLFFNDPDFTLSILFWTPTISLSTLIVIFIYQRFINMFINLSLLYIYKIRTHKLDSKFETLDSSGPLL